MPFYIIVFSKQIFVFITMNMDMISVYCSSRNWCRPVSILVLLQAVTDWLSNTDTLSVCFRINENFSSKVLLVQIFYQDMKIIYLNPEPASVAQLDASSDWRPGGRGFNPRRGRQHSFVEIDPEIFSTVILSLPLIQEGQLSVSGERMCTILVNRLED